MKRYYKGYYMMTARCNLACSYCVLENSPEQLSNELSFEGKKGLIAHLYEVLGFRSLTLSGGEPLIIDKGRFIELLGFLRGYKHPERQRNLQIRVYTNGLLLTPEIAKAMHGVVDRVDINIDSRRNDILSLIGRTSGVISNYYEKAVGAIRMLYEEGIPVQLHSVISRLNIKAFPEECSYILSDVKEANPLIRKWKIFQYMTYDNKEKDEIHRVSNEEFQSTIKQIENALHGQEIVLKFKTNELMDNSLFNILATGIAQYRMPGDTWTTTRRTSPIRNYNSMEQLLEENGIDRNQFNEYHSFEV